MGYSKSNGQWADTQDVTLAASAARTATGNGDAVELGDRGTAALTLDVTAVGGTTPSATVTIETSKDGSTGWTAVAAFSAATAVSAQRKVFAGLDRYVRASWAISGTTPSLTFSVAGEAK